MNIAVIGAGISGLVAAYLLCRDHTATVLEANDYAGGDTHTVELVQEGIRFPVDTGFIVFNEEIYPDFVTLNYAYGIRPSEIFRRIIYHHPVYTCEGMQARKRRDEINGVNRTWYCRAYCGYGFHEDGVNSAWEVCRHFGRTLT